MGPRGSCFDLCHRVFCLFSSKSFILSGLTFTSLIHFYFIFVYGVRKRSNFILLHVAVQLSQHYIPIFTIVYSCLLCQRIIVYRCAGLFLDSPFCSIDSYVCLCSNFNYCNFEVLPEVWEAYVSCIAVFTQNCLDNSESLRFLIDFDYMDLCRQSYGFSSSHVWM